MVLRSKNGYVMGSKFGKGTVKIMPKIVLSTTGQVSGRVELSTCSPHKLGDDVLEESKGLFKIVLDFSNTQSIDILILKLKELKEEMGELDGEA